MSVAIAPIAPATTASHGGSATSDLFTNFNTDDTICMVVIFIACIFARGGVGAAGIFVPIYMLTIKLSTKPAIALSSITTIAVSLVTCVVCLRGTHPFRQHRPMIDFELFLILEPMFLIGTTIGVLFNIIFADLMILLLFFVILICVFIWNTKKAVRMCKSETRFRHKLIRTLSTPHPSHNDIQKLIIDEELKQNQNQLQKTDTQITQITQSQSQSESQSEEAYNCSGTTMSHNMSETEKTSKLFCLYWCWNFLCLHCICCNTGHDNGRRARTRARGMDGDDGDDDYLLPSNNSSNKNTGNNNKNRRKSSSFYYSNIMTDSIIYDERQRTEMGLHRFFDKSQSIKSSAAAHIHTNSHSHTPLLQKTNSNSILAARVQSDATNLDILFGSVRANHNNEREREPISDYGSRSHSHSHSPNADNNYMVEHRAGEEEDERALLLHNNNSTDIGGAALTAPGTDIAAETAATAAQQERKEQTVIVALDKEKENTTSSTTSTDNTPTQTQTGTTSTSTSASADTPPTTTTMTATATAHLSIKPAKVVRIQFASHLSTIDGDRKWLDLIHATGIDIDAELAKNMHTHKHSRKGHSDGDSDDDDDSDGRDGNEEDVVRRRRRRRRRQRQRQRRNLQMSKKNLSGILHKLSKLRPYINEETKILKPFVISVFMWALSIGAFVIRTQFAIDRCSALSWLIQFATWPLLLVFCIYFAFRSYTNFRAKLRYGWVPFECDIQWHRWPQLVLYVCIGLSAGVGSGCLGIPSGMFISPILIYLNSLPRVASATSAYVVLLTSSSTAVQYALLGYINFTQAAVYMSVAMAGALIGRLILDYFVSKFGRLSLIISAISLIICASIVLMFVNGIMFYFESNSNELNQWVQFSSACGVYFPVYGPL